LFRASVTYQEGYVTSCLHQSATKITTDSACTNDEYSHLKSSSTSSFATGYSRDFTRSIADAIQPRASPIREPLSDGTTRPPDCERARQIVKITAAAIGIREQHNRCARTVKGAFERRAADFDVSVLLQSHSPASRLTVGA
jgi:hypothetical protein